MPDTLRRILAIFRKDARRLWPYGAIFAALLAGAASSRSTDNDFYFEKLALPLACCSLIVLAIHEDRLVGDRQYWLARPYDWRELLAAKALSVVVFVQLPVFLQQAVTLITIGTSPAEHWQALIENQIALAIFLVTPVAALAAVTRNLAQMVMAALLISLALLWFLFRGPILPATPLYLLTPRAASIVVSGAVAALLLQYARRRTTLARAAIAVAVVAVLVVASREQMMARVNHFYSQVNWRDDVRIRLDPSEARRAHAAIPLPEGPVRVDIPIILTGIPAGTEIGTDDMALGLRGPGIPLGSGANRACGVSRDADGQAWLNTYIKHEDFDSVGDLPVDLYGSMDLTLFSDRWTAPLPPRSTIRVPGVGACRDLRTESSHSVECVSPKITAAVQFESPRGDRVWIVPPSLITQPLLRRTALFYYRMPGTVMWTDQALWRSNVRPLVEFQGFGFLDRFHTAAPVASEGIGENRLIARTPAHHFRVAFNLNSIRLRDYVAR